MKLKCFIKKGFPLKLKKKKFAQFYANLLANSAKFVRTRVLQKQKKKTGKKV